MTATTMRGITLDDLRTAIRLVRCATPENAFDEIWANKVMLQQIEDLICAGKEIAYAENGSIADLNGIAMGESPNTPDGLALICLNGRVVGTINLLEMKVYFFKHSCKGSAL